MLAGLQIVVGFSIFNIPRIQVVWQTGSAPMFVMLITIVATLVALIQVAVALGVVLHILMHIFRSAETVRLERVAPMEDGYLSEGDSLKICPAGKS